jgi:ribulose-phosphate 3-epimerase
VDAFIAAGAEILTVHAEATAHLHRLLGYIREKGVKAGVSLNPGTPIYVLEEVIPMLDLVLAMTVNPGLGGQKFIPGGIEKVMRLKDMLSSGTNPVMLEVDGGVNRETAPILWQAGADILVAGSYIFGSKNYAEAVASIKKRITR